MWFFSLFISGLHEIIKKSGYYLIWLEAHLILSNPKSFESVSRFVLPYAYNWLTYLHDTKTGTVSEKSKYVSRQNGIYVD